MNVELRCGIYVLAVAYFLKELIQQYRNGYILYDGNTISLVDCIPFLISILVAVVGLIAYLKKYNTKDGQDK